MPAYPKQIIKIVIANKYTLEFVHDNFVLVHLVHMHLYHSSTSVNSDKVETDIINIYFQKLMSTFIFAFHLVEFPLPCEASYRAVKKHKRQGRKNPA
jgi:hypothetical protein